MRKKRTGIVSIEYVVFLPLFLILYGWLMTITSATFTQMDTEMEARRIAWKNRIDPPKSRQTKSILHYSNSAISLTRMTERNPNALTHSNVIRTGPSFFKDVALTTQQKNNLVGGGWDHRQLKFQTSSNRRDLVPDKMLFQFSDLRVFDAQFLKNFLNLPRGRFSFLSNRMIRFVESIF